MEQDRMRMIVAALVALSLPVSTAQAQERTAPKRVQQMNWNADLIEGRQSATSSFPGQGVVLTLDSNSPRAVEENWFARAENRGQTGGGGGGAGGD
jgi:hypothetical protein